MSDAEELFHKAWLGMVQPIEGLVVSIPVLVAAQCMERLTPQVQQKVVGLCRMLPADEGEGERVAIAELGEFLAQVLGLTPDLFDAAERLPAGLELYVHEGRQTLRPSMALRRQREVVAIPESPDVTPAMRAGAGYEMLVWDLPEGLELDRPETQTGTWDYPPSAKFDRLLRHCRVPIGLLTNREVVRLIYAPHGESSGAITFRLDAMVSVGGRPILDAFVMLLSANRFFGVAEERALPAILAESRKRQANVTNDLAEQVFEALQVLLRGFESAAERDGRDLLDDALARDGDHLYKGLLTVLLRLVFLLYAEDRSLLPIENDFYAEHLSVLGLFERLQADQGAHPDSMSRRFGAWGRLVTLFRAVFLGIEHGTLKMPPRRGSLFNPHEYPFLEGWGPAGSAPITQPDDRARVRVPTIDDETVFRMLEKLLLFEGQRLSYRALDVEQIGSVYEALMGYHVKPLKGDAVSLRLNSKPGAVRAWVEVDDALRREPSTRTAWLRDELGFDNAHSRQVANVLASLGSSDNEAALSALLDVAAGRSKDRLRFRGNDGQLVLQPGAERRRTSTHYTPRTLSAPIVKRTLAPLLACMGDAPTSDRILNLKVCDPAMGSGAFLVEACRFLGDQVLAAWTREGKVASVAAQHGNPLLHAQRLVAQRCLYGVDKNDAAVELAKLSIWLVTLSKGLPFTFLDHCLRHGDSLVGLDFDQIRAFHWRKPDGQQSRQLDLFGREIAAALDEAISLRQKIGDLGDSVGADQEKARLFWDAQDALDRVRLIGDLVVGAFLEKHTSSDREAERARREGLVREWLLAGGPPSQELLALQYELRRHLPVFHWMVEFPEVFFADRPDPLDDDQINRAAFMDAFVGNPPFLTGKDVGRTIGPAYSVWLSQLHGTTRNPDLCAHFFRRANQLLGLHGTLGLIATDKIAQGETRTASLEPLLASGTRIYRATSSMPWPGEAGVTIAVVHAARGRLLREAQGAVLDGKRVSEINSHLTAGPEQSEPMELRSNSPLSFQGVILYPDSFAISPAQRASLIRASAKNAARIRPYLGGEEVNTSPTQAYDWFVIDLSDLTLEQAGQWPELLEWLRVHVAPERATKSPEVAAYPWWKFWRPRRELYAAIADLREVLVIARDPQHFCFVRQPTDRVFNEKLCVLALDSMSAFAVLQSRVHLVWSKVHGRTTGGAGTLSYSNTKCFDTFPFPQPDPRGVTATLEDIGQRLYEFRARYMVDNNVGLTTTYNRLKDPACTEPRILELRNRHEEMDRAVVAAYAEGDPEGRWGELDVPPYCPMSDEEQPKVSAFQSAVIDKLFILNAKRAAAERGTGQPRAGSKQKRCAESLEPRSPKKGRGKPAKEQLTLTSPDPDAES